MDDVFLFEEVEIENFYDIIKQFNSVIDRYRIKSKLYFNHIDRDSFLQECDLIKKYFDNNDCTIGNIATIELPPKSQGSLHTDSYRNTLAMNFPIFNCQDSYTSLYKVIDGTPYLKSLSNGLTAMSYDKCTAIEISRYHLKNKAIMFNTQIPHRVFNNSDKPRLAISFRFIKDPWHLTNYSTKKIK